MWVSMNKDLLFPIRNESDLGLDGSGSLTWLSGGSHAMAGLQNCSVLGPWSQMATQPRVGAGRKGDDCSCQLNDMPQQPHLPAQWGQWGHSSFGGHRLLGTKNPAEWTRLVQPSPEVWGAGSLC